ncbi:hypothetical protein AB1N83_011958 [Pleurotus pulmonarius]
MSQCHFCLIALPRNKEAGNNENSVNTRFLESPAASRTHPLPTPPATQLPSHQTYQFINENLQAQTLPSTNLLSTPPAYQFINENPQAQTSPALPLSPPPSVPQNRRLPRREYTQDAPGSTTLNSASPSRRSLAQTARRQRTRCIFQSATTTKNKAHTVGT